MNDIKFTKDDQIRIQDQRIKDLQDDLAHMTTDRDEWVQACCTTANELHGTDVIINDLEVERDEARRWARKMKAERDAARAELSNIGALYYELYQAAGGTIGNEVFEDFAYRIIGERDTALAAKEKAEKGLEEAKNQIETMRVLLIDAKSHLDTGTGLCEALENIPPRVRLSDLRGIIRDCDYIDWKVGEA